MTHLTQTPRTTPLLEGSAGDIHKVLARFNQDRFGPAQPDSNTVCEAGEAVRFHRMEVGFVEALRHEASKYLAGMPDTPETFIVWFESLKEWGPGQNDPLFPWLADHATTAQMQWFLQQEVAGEIGFDDLVAMTHIRMPPRVKLEMARNYWDEMGRGQEKGMHGLMLQRLAGHFGLRSGLTTTVSEALALGNLMSALASHRQYAFHSVGALGVIELTAPTRARYVRDGLARLKVPAKVRHYFALHAVLDVKHSQAWNNEVIAPLVAGDFARARSVAEGAVMRLLCGLRCFEVYRRNFGI